MTLQRLLHPDLGVLILAEFAVAAYLVFRLGSVLVRSGDAIGRSTGLGGTWVGLALLAVVTSVPEIVGTVGSVVRFRAVDMAAGNVFGSCMFNLLLIAVLDMLEGRGPVLRSAGPSHTISASFGVMLIAMAAGSVVVAKAYPAAAGLVTVAANVGLVVGWLAAMRLTYLFGKREPAAEEREPGMSTGAAVARFLAAAVGVVIIGLWLVQICNALASHEFASGGRTFTLGRTFVGTLFLAVATSLPEAAVTISCIRIGALDMGIANLLGSNVCNMAILPIADLALRGGSIYGLASLSHSLTATAALLCTAIVMVGLVYRSQRSFMRLGWDSVAVVVIYAATSAALFASAAG